MRVEGCRKAELRLDPTGLESGQRCVKPSVEIWVRPSLLEKGEASQRAFPTGEKWWEGSGDGRNSGTRGKILKAVMQPRHWPPVGRPRGTAQVLILRSEDHPRSFCSKGHPFLLSPVHPSDEPRGAAGRPNHPLMTEDSLKVSTALGSQTGWGPYKTHSAWPWPWDHHQPLVEPTDAREEPPAVGDPPIWKLTMEPEATWKFPQLCLAPKPDQDYLKASTFGWSTNQPCEDPRGPKVTTALTQVRRSRLWKARLCILIGQLLCLLHPGSCSPRRSPRGEGAGHQTGRDSCGPAAWEGDWRRRWHFCFLCGRHCTRRFPALICI